MDAAAMPPEIVDRLPWVALAVWQAWKKLEQLIESQKSQGQRIGNLEAKVARLQPRGGDEGGVR